MKKFTAILVSLLLALTATISASATVLTGTGSTSGIDLSSITDALSGIDASSLLSTSDFDITSLLGGIDLSGMLGSLGGISESGSADTSTPAADGAETPAADNSTDSGDSMDIGSLLGGIDLGDMDIGSLLGGLGDFDIGSLLGDFDIGSLLGGDASGILDTIGGLFNSDSNGGDKEPTTNAPSDPTEPSTGSIVDTGDC